MLMKNGTEAGGVLDNAAVVRSEDSSARRTTERFDTLICAEEGFPALERLALEATKTLHLSFRIFDVETRLHSDEALERGLQTWKDLLAHVSQRGVTVRLLLADFDPIFASTLHWDAWCSVTALAAVAPEIEVICALHAAHAGAVWNALATPYARRLLLKHRKNGIETPRIADARRGDWALRPVTLHQKFAVADRNQAIIGGLDVDERRWDDKDHTRKAPKTWHDVSVAVSGGICARIDAHFADCWKQARETGGRSPVAEPTTPDTPPPETESTLRLLRTRSFHRTGAFLFAPQHDLTEHEEAHIEAFAKAERSIYIETQYFRHRPIAEALAEAAARSPRLEVILLVPAEPERIAFSGARDLAARHEQALQMHSIKICKTAFGDRMVVVSPAQTRRAGDDEGHTLESAPLVYVHSKVTIVDDALAIVGSANLNGRSMRWDTEASVLTRNTDDVTRLRNRLAHKWMGDTEGNISAVQTWRSNAQANVERPPECRENFILEFPEKRTRRFSRYFSVFPDEMF